MPSLQQLRHEALADAVDRASRVPLLLMLFNVRQEPLNVRVETHDGVTIECRLLQVDLDGGQLVGLDRCLPLARVKGVWHHQRRMGRALLVWFATLLGSAAIGGVLAAANAWGRFADGAVGGALVGAIAGIGVLLLIDKWEALYEWILLYEGAAA